jgi:transcriptional regulator with XRE-family HTH domain
MTSLRIHRIRHHLSQAQLADELICSQSTISRLENGKTTIVRKYIRLGLERLFAMPVDELLRSVESKKRAGQN